MTLAAAALRKSLFKRHCKWGFLYSKTIDKAAPVPFIAGAAGQSKRACCLQKAGDKPFRLFEQVYSAQDFSDRS